MSNRSIRTGSHSGNHALYFLPSNMNRLAMLFSCAGAGLFQIDVVFSPDRENNVIESKSSKKKPTEFDGALTGDLHREVCLLQGYAPDSAITVQ
jgi:hypothetical protein